MNKTELIDAIADEADISKASATRVVDAFIKHVADALARGDSVTISGFGSFTVRERTARTGRNPRTGETIQIAAAKSPAFKAGKAFKDALN